MARYGEMTLRQPVLASAYTESTSNTSRCPRLHSPNDLSQWFGTSSMSLGLPMASHATTPSAPLHRPSTYIGRPIVLSQVSHPLAFLDPVTAAFSLGIINPPPCYLKVALPYGLHPSRLHITPTCPNQSRLDTYIPLVSPSIIYITYFFPSAGPPAPPSSSLSVLDQT